MTSWRGRVLLRYIIIYLLFYSGLIKHFNFDVKNSQILMNYFGPKLFLEHIHWNNSFLFSPGYRFKFDLQLNRDLIFITTLTPFIQNSFF
jgi:hypothetical protein